ncbi:MAG: 1-deoxy-D-xylulose-5-phosphate synthase [Candidatus Omnitrophica bacterium]|nr:1-deoxy-D-xylulose-5-phosphate synthase [Candidatus Omnitrophota bacterium]
MILDTIATPADLKRLNLKELESLSAEIRGLIIDVVSKKGGHLASSLGSVDLCIALHYCLNTPDDSLLFDVGHQAYAHKIITGRSDSFTTLREYKGISGFPNCQESAFDVYTCGHASTAVSWAQGIAEAKRLKQETSKTVAIVGDGALTGGMCFEALNSCGHAQSDVLIILNNNELSIAPSVGALSNYLNKIISAPVYNRIKSELETFLKHFQVIKKLSPTVRRFEEALKGLIVPGIFFEELGFRYFGPFDGHNLETLIPTLKNVVSLKGPRLLHVVTKKGKGYVPAERNPEDFHSAVPFAIDSGNPLKNPKHSFGEIFAKKLIALAEVDERITAITAAMPKGTGLNLFADKFPRRFFDVGIAEGHAVGFASGLAKKGLKPVVAIYSTFLQRAFDQIIHDVALQNSGVIFAIDRAGTVGEDGPTHHGVFDIGYMRIVPNMVCMAPKDKEETEDMLSLALTLESPVSIRYPKGEAYSLDKRQPVELGKAEILREGKDVCIVAVGSMVKTALECANVLDESGIHGAIVNARFIKPLDEDLLKNIAGTFSLIVTIEEGNLHCGFGSAVLEFYDREELSQSIKLIRAGFPDEFIPNASRENLLKMYGLDARSLARRIKKILLKEEIVWQRSR